MKAGWLLAGAVACEVSGSLAMKAAVEVPGWYAVTAAGYTASFVLLALVLGTGMPVGKAYGMWGATGVALTAVLSAVIFGEPLTPPMGLGVLLVIVGVLLVEFGSHPQARDSAGQASTAESTAQEAR